jgi:hypothetical protein
MFAPKGDPFARNLFMALNALQKRTGVEFRRTQS